MDKNSTRGRPDDGLDLLEAPPQMLHSPSEVYHENSKLRASDHELYAWISFVNSSPDIQKIITRPFVHYTGYPSIELPTEFEPTAKGFEEIVKGRRSAREFSGAAMRLEQLAKVIYLGDGIVQKVQTEHQNTWYLRTAPSGGGIYPVELFCAVMRVDGVTPGLYFYSPLDHKLECVNEGDLTETLVAAASSLKESIEQASVCLILSATMPRIKFKYGERAYRFVLLEAGHIAQNIMLTAEAEQLSAVPVGGFLDDDLNRLLAFDGVEQIVLYLVLVGLPASR